MFIGISTSGNSGNVLKAVEAAKAIAGGQIVGWFQGPMEFGPRALGNRSIVVDPRRADMSTLIIVGSSETRIVPRRNGAPFVYTPRGKAAR